MKWVIKSMTDPCEPVRAALDVLAERRRQVEAEGWTPEHDDSHETGELAAAAACYALHGLKSGCAYWPWGEEWWKPKDRRSDLVRAGALILAEIERLDRAQQRKDEVQQREVCAGCDTPSACREEGCRNV